MTSADQYTPERIADRAMIQDVLFKWCRSIDRLDYAGIRDVFHPNARDEHGVYNGDVDGLVEWVRERHRTIPFSMHTISNILIEFASPDLAFVEAYVRTTQRYPSGAAGALAQMVTVTAGEDALATRDLWTCSRYLDRFERRRGLWRVADRKVVPDWKLVTTVPSEPPRNVPGSLQGRRDQNDPMYLARLALGIGAE